MICMFFALQALAVAASTHASDADSSPKGRYLTLMRAQYASHAAAIPQLPEEAHRIYENYLNSIGERVEHKTEEPIGNTGDQSR